jgi:hypothetical protein
MTRKPVVAILVAVALTIAVAAGVAITPGTASNGHASARGLVGTWTQTVNRPAPLPPLQSIQVFNRGGTGVETSNEPPGVGQHRRDVHRESIGRAAATRADSRSAVEIEAARTKGPAWRGHSDLSSLTS